MTKCPTCGTRLWDVNDIANYLGIHVKSVPRLRRDDSTFPAPHVASKAWVADDIEAWASEHRGT